MRTVTIRRTESDDLGTFGTLTTDTASFSCYTAELPWRDNKPSLSCIPEGQYRVVWGLSVKHGPVYCVINVKDRAHIQIHPGNWSGDVKKGYKSNVEGCILLGRSIMDIMGQKGVSSSRDAIQAFEDDMEHQPFNLVIIR